MKKTLSFLLALVMVLGLCACGASNAPAATQAPAATEAPATVETEAPAEEPVAAVDTKILYEADDSMLNTYTVIAVNPDAPFTDADGNAVSDVAVNTAGADALIHWLLSQTALDMAADFGMEDYGEHLFYVKDDAPVYDGEIAAAT